MGVLPKLSRRNFLRAAGASSVGIAVPPALVERRAMAAPPARPRFRVLSLDGGGARGYLSIKILANIEAYIDDRTQKKIPVGQRFDLIAGTSTGGIIALGLASGRT